MKKSKFFLAACLMLIMFSCSKKDSIQQVPAEANANTTVESVLVTGTVVDAVSHDAIVGASVSQIGSAFGTITNSLGAFSIFTEVGGTLQFSFIGYYTQQRVINGATHLGVIQLVPIMEGRP